jgi:hypothetical protein
MTNEPGLEQLNCLVGRWTTDATHPSLTGVVLNGTAIIEWFEGERFLIHRAHLDHPAFPDSISIIGITGHDRVDNPTITIPRWFPNLFYACTITTPAVSSVSST